MVAPNELVLIDLAFLLQSNEDSFCGAPLILDLHGQDNTVLYGVARDLLRLRYRLGIRRAIVIIGREATTASAAATINRVVSFLSRLGVATVCNPRATIVTLCRSLSSAHWILTKNKVLFQLVTGTLGIIVPDMASGALEIVTLESLKSTLGLRPAQIPSFLSLTDGGKKALFTKRQAIRLIEVYDNVSKLLQALPTIPSHSMRRKLSAHADVLRNRLGSVAIEEPVSPPVGLIESELTFVKDDQNTAETLRKEGLWSLVRLLPQPMTMRVPVVTKVQSKVTYKLIRNEAGLRKLEALVSKADICAVDTEASNKDAQSASLLGVAFSVNAEEAFYVPVIQGDLVGLTTEVVKDRVQKLLAGRTRFVGHNIKFDCVLFRRHGITVKNVLFDTMLAAYECFGDWEFFNLSALARKLLGREIKRYRDVVGEGETLLDVPFNELVEHACADADVTLQLYHRLKQELEDRKLLQQFFSQAMALLRTLIDKECNGVRLNIKAANRRREALAQEVDTLRRAVIAQAGKEFDLDSSIQTASALREISPFGERVGRRVTVAELEQLAGLHSLPRLIVKYRRAQKLGRELETICARAKKGRVFPTFSQVRWAHGSLSSTDPRICDPGGPLDATVVIDRTIREHMGDANRALDILQRIAGDEIFEKDWCGGSDHPSFIGIGTTGRDLDQKDLLLSVAIGISDAALSKRFLIDRRTAAGMRQALEAKYAKLFKWLDIYRRDTVTQGHAHHNGRRKYLEGLKSSDLDKRQKALQSAVRWLIRY